MVTYINDKNSSNIMKKFFIAMLLVMFIGSVYSIETSLLNWKFEEGDGTIVLDGSDNNNFGVITGATYDSGTKKWGNFAIRLDGDNDYVSTITPRPMENLTTFNLWLYREDGSGFRTIFIVSDTTLEHFSLSYNKDTLEYEILYRDDTDTQRQILIPYAMTKELWTMITFSIDYPNNRIILKHNTNEIYNQVLPYTLRPIDNNNILKLGNNVAGLNDLKGRIDEVSVYNFIPTTAQLSTLFTTNVMNYNTTPEPETNVTDSVPLNIINSTSPVDNSNVSNPVLFEVMLNYKSHCELYIDGQKTYTYYDILSFTQSHVFEVGEHSYFVYCHYTSNQTLNYEASEVFSINVTLGNPVEINFVVSGNDFDVNDQNLYITTPCIKHSIDVGTLTDGVDSVINEEKSIYIQRLENGISQFMLSPATHEFCLVNGDIQYDKNDYTDNFNINKIVGVASLGSFNIPSNVTQTYTIKADLIDVYDNYNPKAWGKTWAGIIGGLMMFIIGVLITLAGVKSQNGKITLAGVILVLSAFGVSLAGIFVGALF